MQVQTTVLYFETDDVIVGDVPAKFLFSKNDVFYIDDSVVNETQLFGSKPKIT